MTDQTTLISGLAGVVAAETTLSMVDGEAGTLIIAGFPLAELALDFAMSHLQPGGDLVVKVFQGAGLDAFQREFRRHFTKTYLRKPKASRDRSREHYLVGKGFVAAA